MQIKRLAPLDSLRGIAAIGVAFFWHYQHLAPQNESPFRKAAYWFYTYGWNLVDFFFVLSGFIFSYIYLQNLIEKKITLKEFSILRLSRLYPLHLITLLLVAVVQFIRSLKFNDFFVYTYNDTYHFLLNIFFIQSGWFESGYSFNAPTWSISSEVVAYLLFFLILLKFNKNYVFCFVGFVFIGLFIIKTKLQLPLFNASIARVLIGFFIGCLAYKLNMLMNKSKDKNLWLILSGFILLIISLLGIAFGQKVFGEWTIVYVVLIYPLIIILSINLRILSNILSIKPLVYLGEISYSIYLWHFPVQLLIKTFDDSFLLHLNYSSKKMFLGYILLTLIISIVSYEFIEKPAQKYLRKNGYKKLLTNNKSVELGI